jgi:hypothetical protein
MIIRGKWLLWHLIAVVALFVIAFPLGDKHHGMGEHNAFLAVLGQIVFTTFLLAAVLLIVAAVVALVQAVYTRLPSRQSRRSA